MPVETKRIIPNFLERTITDTSTITLIGANLVTIFLAIYQNWNLSTLMWIYWCQSVIIGIFTFIKILEMENFETSGFTINGRQPTATGDTKKETALFFAMHYGFFHFGYFIFLLADQNVKLDLILVVVCALAFLAHHTFSYFTNRETDKKIKRNIGTVMFYPYARIIPMHLTIIFGPMFGAALPLFLGLKLVADVIMHLVEHYGKV